MTAVFCNFDTLDKHYEQTNRRRKVPYSVINTSNQTELAKNYTIGVRLKIHDIWIMNVQLSVIASQMHDAKPRKSIRIATYLQRKVVRIWCRP